MTKNYDENVEDIKKTVVGKKIVDLYHENDGDYLVMKIDDGNEIYFRLMEDIANGQ